MSEVDWVQDWISSPGPYESVITARGGKPSYDDYTGELLDD